MEGSQLCEITAEQKEEIQRLIQAGRTSPRIIAQLVFKKTSIHISEQVTKQWCLKIIEQRLIDPPQQHVDQLLLYFVKYQHKMCLAQIQRAMNDTFFCQKQYIKIFLQRHFLKLIRLLGETIETIVSKFNCQKLGIIPFQSISSVRQYRCVLLLLKKINKSKLFKTTAYFREKLIQYHFSLRKKTPLKKGELISIYKAMTKVAYQVVSERVYDKHEQWSYAWTDKEKDFILEKYELQGDKIRNITADLVQMFGEKQNYAYLNVRQQIVKMIRDGLKRLKQIAQKQGVQGDSFDSSIKFPINLQTAKRFVSKKNQKGNEDQKLKVSCELIRLGRRNIDYKMSMTQIVRIYDKISIILINKK